MIRTLVVAPQWIGDVVMCEPLLATLAARGETVSVAALPSVAPVLRAMPEVAEVIELPFAHGRLDLAARWRAARPLRGRFERALVLPNSFKAALLPWFAGIRERWGYVGEARRVLLTRAWPNPPGRPPMVRTYGALSGDTLAEHAVPRLALPASTIDVALGAAGLERAAYWAFAPGAEYGPSKRWPAGHYAALARRLHDASGLPVVLLGSRAEAAMCEQIAAAANGACRVLAGRTALLDALALVAAARALVSNDSGLMHVAAAFGVPQVAVFGSTSPEHTPPLSQRARVLWLKDELGLTCMPCFERTCRYGHTRCLVGVAPERVEAALRDALASAPTGATA
jgi:heptosyltransferase-2